MDDRADASIMRYSDWTGVTDNGTDGKQEAAPVVPVTRGPGRPDGMAGALERAAGENTCYRER